ncbi:MAG: HU family DNA-binding protein [Myxococcales bacterium]|nr:HU family DNA-binding protein [Myxococcales bacterium]
MTKKEAISAIHAQFANDLTKKQVGEIFDALFDAASGALKNEGRLSYPGFGTLTVKTVAARTGRNPQTGEAIEIAASKRITFKPAAELKAKLN